MSNILTKDQINDYKTNGFIYPVPVIPSIKADYYAKKLLSFQNQHPEHLSGIKARKLHLILTWMADLISEKVILDAVEDLLGPNIMCWSSTLFIKDAENPAFVSWHQDGNYWGLSNDELTTAWLALTPSTVLNGCMKMLPGSHKWPKIDHEQTTDRDNLLSKGQVIKKEITDSDSVNLCINSGEISLHHINVAHSSGPNNSKSKRIGIAIRYITPHVRQLNNYKDSATLVRGTDTYNNFEHEPIPKYDYETASMSFFKKFED
ncbi:MAG: phytanoyl-CoA dioxygenase [Rhodospirillaceae bacterium]|nr:phytanoyl-CoA dioxygenase [Rhodospirillaceae bacterium]